MHVLGIGVRRAPAPALCASVRPRRRKFMRPVIRSSLLALAIFSETAWFADSASAALVCRPNEFAGYAQESQSCQGRCASLSDSTAVRHLDLALRQKDQSVTDRVGAKKDDEPFEARLSSKEATNAKRPTRNANADSAAAEQSRAQLPEPHWSRLPIWGPDAAARGHRIPPPFGIGVTYYHARQPVNVSDLKLGVRGGTPQSISDFAQVGRVDSTQQNVSGRFDVWLFPFLNLYGIVGYTTGNTKGAVTIPDVPILGIVAQDLPLRAEFKGPTYGGGVTLGGGFRITEWRDLHAFIVGDVNHTITRLSFVNESLIAHTEPEATVASFRLGLRGEVTESIKTSMWVGAMYQRIQEEVAGSIAGRSIEFIITQRAAHPWNTLIGGQIEVGKHFNVIVEGGIGSRSSILTGATFRF